MKIFGKDITEQEAIYLLKIQQDYHIKGHNIIFYWDRDLVDSFTRIFDEQGYTYSPEDLTPEGVSRAVFEILAKENPKACFYAASILRGSNFPIKQFERVILEQCDYESQIAYLATFQTDRAQEFADSIADSGMSFYNLTMLINCPKVMDTSRNIDVVNKYGTIMQRLYMAKYVPGIDIEAFRQDVLASNRARPNYLFSKYITDRFVTKGGNAHSSNPEGKINYITDFYANFHPVAKKIMTVEHRQAVRDTRDVEYCFKLARNDRPCYGIKNSLWDDTREIEQIVLDSEDPVYIAKFATEVKGADRQKCIQKLTELGETEHVEYVQMSLTIQDFFDKNQNNARC
ncbi:MAG: hypothetical protein IKC79_00400 [Clostridia bacterium]|nr:hypothetical protein [Clostridia bacterium]